VLAASVIEDSDDDAVSEAPPSLALELEGSTVDDVVDVGILSELYVCSELDALSVLDALSGLADASEIEDDELWPAANAASYIELSRASFSEALALSELCVPESADWVTDEEADEEVEPASPLASDPDTLEEV